ncbi:hypothetical protein ACS0TY_021041 [Phlomoides rotata]
MDVLPQQRSEVELGHSPPGSRDMIYFANRTLGRPVSTPHDFVVRSPTQIRSDDDRFPSTTHLKIAPPSKGDGMCFLACQHQCKQVRHVYSLLKGAPLSPALVHFIVGWVAHSLVTRANIRVGVTKNAYAGEGRLGTITDDSGGFYMPLQGDEGGTNEVSFYTSFSSNTKVSGHITRFFPKFDGTQLMEASDGSCMKPHLILQDITFQRANPSVMDIKIGSRTWPP